MAGLKFFVPGIPETKGSWIGLGGGKMKRDNPREKAWAIAVGWAAKAAAFAAVKGRPTSGPSSRRIRAVIDCFIPPPKGKKNQRDVDKLARSILDALSGLLYKDDEQVDELHIRKIVRERAPGADIKIEEIIGIESREASLVIEQVLAERHRQDEQWGPHHDDDHEPCEWLSLIDEHRVRARKTIADRDAYRHRLVVIAALAIAAIESFDRGGKAGV